MSAQAAPVVNCPFYGRHIVLSLVGASPFPVHQVLLLDSDGGNQCALWMHGYHPCELAIADQAVEWRGCPRMEAATVHRMRRT